MSNKHDQLRPGNHDGIQEYDNDLPRWWVALLWGTVVFSVVYVGYYSFGPGLSPAEQLAVDLEELKQAKSKAEAANSAPADTDESLAALAGDPKAVQKGSEIFHLRCLACHGPEGQGLVGPNLTDAYWIHGSRPTELSRVIRKGVLEKGMLPWEGVLQPDEIRAVIAFVLSIRGTNPANPKPPQGVDSSGAAPPAAG